MQINPKFEYSKPKYAESQEDDSRTVTKYNKIKLMVMVSAALSLNACEFPGSLAGVLITPIYLNESVATKIIKEELRASGKVGELDTINVDDISYILEESDKIAKYEKQITSFAKSSKLTTGYCYIGASSYWDIISNIKKYRNTVIDNQDALTKYILEHNDSKIKLQLFFDPQFSKPVYEVKTSQDSLRSQVKRYLNSIE